MESLNVDPNDLQNTDHGSVLYVVNVTVVISNLTKNSSNVLFLIVLDMGYCRAFGLIAKFGHEITACLCYASVWWLELICRVMFVIFY